MSEAMRRLGYEDGYASNDVRHPAKQSYLEGYAEGYADAASDTAFTEQQMKFMENEGWKHE